MRSFFLALLLCIFVSGAAAAQSGSKQGELDALESQISKVESVVQEKARDDDVLVKLRSDLERLSRSLIEFGVSLRPRLKEINSRLEELGPAPQAGDPVEPDLLTSERKLLLQEKAQFNAFIGSAESLSIRVSEAINIISTQRRELFANKLFQRTDISSALSGDTWGDFQRQVGMAWRDVSSRLQFMFAFRTQQLLLAVGLSLLFGIGTYFGVRRAFGFMVEPRGKEIDWPYIAKLSMAFWSTIIPSLAVVASLAVAFGLFAYFGVFTSDTLNLTEALLISFASIFFIQRLANALLSPLAPKRRLILVSDGTARILVALVVCLAVIHVVDYFFGRLFVTFSAPLNLTVLKSLVSSLAISAVLIVIALVKPFRDQMTQVPRGWPRLVRLSIILVALFIVGSVVTGYVGLARFSAAQVVVTGAILATMYIGVQSGQVLAAESVFPSSFAGHQLKSLFSVSDAALDQLGLLLSFVVYAIVIVVGLPLILLQWGFNHLDIQTWLYRILTDIRIGTISISLLGVLFGIFLFVVGFLVTRRFQRWLDGSVMARSKVDPGVRNSIRTVVGYAGVFLAAMIGISAAGFDLTSLALVAGALSLGIGFGLQNIVNNFVSGLILLAERPFKVGDWIVAGNTAGFVRKISVRATEIETFQNQTIILPNSELINNPVGNWTHRDHRGRVEIAVGAAYGVNPRKVYDLLLELATKDPEVLKKPPPSVVFNGFGDSSLDFELRVHVPEVLDSLAIATRLRFEIMDVFEKNGIAIPFPQRDVNLKVPDIEALAGSIDAVRKRNRPRRKKGP